MTDLFDQVRQNRRGSLICLDESEITTAANRRYARKSAATAGSMVADLYHFLCIAKTWTPRDYHEFVIKPAYIKGFMCGGLHDMWLAKCLKSRVADRRVKAFVKAAQETTNRKG